MIKQIQRDCIVTVNPPLTTALLISKTQATEQDDLEVVSLGNGRFLAYAKSHFQNRRFVNLTATSMFHAKYGGQLKVYGPAVMFEQSDVPDDS